MSFEAYLESVKKQTGLTPEQFRTLADEKGLLRPGTKAGEIVAWLKSDYSLGHGHAMAIYGTLRAVDAPPRSAEDRIDQHFTGKRAAWRAGYDELVHAVRAFGADVTVQAGNSYISLLRSGKKFAIVKVTGERLDVGIKRKDAEPDERFQPSGRWNAMVTHRVQIGDVAELDQELLDWLRAAYSTA